MMNSIDAYDIITELVDFVEKNNTGGIDAFYDFDEDYNKAKEEFFEVLRKELLKDVAIPV